ncbi:hypothetical protein [Sphingobium sp. HWE2-09]|uniref:hypothetical protein n=1 Tax=Sphingobium sp. HWE2-09 TaxID=3108390 RepID=UPI002DC77D40|nr:hypothetical protein [Sphingobium sp. HWE2-09]
MRKLEPNHPAYKTSRRFNSKAVMTYPGQPKDLSSLQERAGPYADMVTVAIEWSAVGIWLMKEYPSQRLIDAGIDGRIASLSVVLVQEASHHEAGWPTRDGSPVSPALYDLSGDCQQEARRTAEEVHALWNAAGRPFLDAKRCRDYFWELGERIRNGLLAPIPGMSADPLPLMDVKLPYSAVLMDRLGKLIEEQRNEP